MPHADPAPTLPAVTPSRSRSAGARLIERPGLCHRVTEAPRAAVLVDAAAYFAALRRTLLAAERQVLIVGWDVDGRTELAGPEGPPDDGAPVALRDLLTWLVERRPDLHVHVLLWDYTLLYALDREPLPSLTLGWRTPDRVHLHLDDRLPMEASHHEKVVVIDDRLAFCGGMDVTIRRWDTPEHRLDDPRRRDPGGDPYPPVHDQQMMVDGPAAAALGDLARDRWRRATHRRLPRPPAVTQETPDPWPADVAPLLRAVPVGISRTRPGKRPSQAVHEIRDLLCAAIGTAERLIYIENQYMTADAIAAALARRLRDRPGLEVVLVGPRTAMDWLEETTMGVGRATFMARLAAACPGAADRVRLLAPVVRDGDRETDVKVHAKLMVVDDRLLTIGSANLANRSMGLDTETILTAEAATTDHRIAIAALRHRLLAEHLGTQPATVATAEAETASPLAAIARLAHRDAPRTLAPVQAAAEAETEAGGVALLTRIGDPERPIDLEDFLAEQVPEAPVDERRRPLSRHLWTGLAVVAVLVAVVLLWRATPLSEGLDPEVFYRWSVGLRELSWTPLAVLGGYVVLGLAAFPITVLITVTGMVFGPGLGFVYAATGAIGSALVSFGVGHLLGRRLVRRYAGATVRRMSEALGARGIVAVVFLRVAPVAPFLLINLVAGASHVRFRDFVVGTVIGMLPGIAVMTLLGTSIMDLIEEPTPGRIAILVGCLALWLLVSVGLQRLANRRGRRAAAERPHAP